MQDVRESELYIDYRTRVHTGEHVIRVFREGRVMSFVLFESDPVPVPLAVDVSYLIDCCNDAQGRFARRSE